MATLQFKNSLFGGAGLQTLPQDGWHFELPAGPVGGYRLAQIDDYKPLARSAFPWQPGTRLSLRARASSNTIPGTWGFGLWNDPFSFKTGLGGAARRTPVLPNAAWFFFASPPNHLALRPGIPAQGNLAATFSSPHWHPLLLALASPGLALLGLPALARRLRPLFARIVHQDAIDIPLDVTGWHQYELEWRRQGCQFRVDGQEITQTSISPQGPLGLVLWIDNQFAAFPPSGRLSFGSLATPNPVWLEICELQCLTID